jgi:hypothetical protein
MVAAASDNFLPFDDDRRNIAVADHIHHLSLTHFMG